MEVPLPCGPVVAQRCGGSHSLVRLPVAVRPRLHDPFCHPCRHLPQTHTDAPLRESQVRYGFHSPTASWGKRRLLPSSGSVTLMATHHFGISRVSDFTSTSGRERRHRSSMRWPCTTLERGTRRGVGESRTGVWNALALAWTRLLQSVARRWRCFRGRGAECLWSLCSRVRNGAWWADGMAREGWRIGFLGRSYQKSMRWGKEMLSGTTPSKRATRVGTVTAQRTLASRASLIIVVSFVFVGRLLSVPMTVPWPPQKAAVVPSMTFKSPTS
ncbi:hypothetical protein FB45DRAFT_125837 [Roridomyces roridus]|uniref:Uncharacterized protein n=1 Tax=Roridomyces roridus TaxID=1738132 RepID=A0AAD7BJL5_9AGAR|nr:hypothetical protein FB45DRAFT_125837 [Roridomyces roridus]